MVDAVELTRQLVGIDSVNPPGVEADCARLVAGLLEAAGFAVTCPAYAPRRTCVVATLDGTDSEPPLALSGHLDTVPFGSQPWRSDPLGGEIADGRLYGRGSSDMKSGVAALVASAAEVARAGPMRRGLVVVLSAGEETGCDGVRFLADGGAPLPQASGLIVAEPTSNRIAVGHKGALWLKGAVRGVTAHGSMPEHGDNAIYKAAGMVARIAEYRFGIVEDPILGLPTLNVGTFAGGANINSVPDRAEFTIDIRSTTAAMHETAMAELSALLGPDAELEVLVDLPPVNTAQDCTFLDCVRQAAGEPANGASLAHVLPFFTDASILSPALGAPTVILGPGETELAHQTDEFCLVDKIRDAQDLYGLIITQWCS